MRIIQCAPLRTDFRRAELVFIGEAYRDSAFQFEIREKIERQTVESSRVRFQSFDLAVNELDAYQQLDVSLDAFLVNSPQRALESLWMGVPVITLADDRLSGRGTASILHSLNRKAWIANTQSDYIEMAKQLAENRIQIRSQRAELRAELLVHAGAERELRRNRCHAIDASRSSTKGGLDAEALLRPGYLCAGLAYRARRSGRRLRGRENELSRG